MKALDVMYKPLNMKMGRLQSNQGRITFAFTDAFIASGLNVSPFKLKLKQGIQTSDAIFRHGLHGLFDDSLPDGWGLLLMDRVMRSKGCGQRIDPLDRLAYIGDNAMGALSYQPSSTNQESEALFDIFKVAEHSIQVFEGETKEVLPALARAGGSPGGARPKVLVGINGKKMVSGESTLPAGYEHWLIKFAAQKDLASAGKMEYIHYQMALSAGLHMTESRLFAVGNNFFFGTKRFDRHQGECVHVHTAGNLIDADFRKPSLDYESLLRLTRILTNNHTDVVAMFRLMVFNVAISNQDDHAKNFSFIMDKQGEWRLSPAYDLTDSSTAFHEHSTSIQGKGRGISDADMLIVGEEHGIDRAQAKEIIALVHDVVSDTHQYQRMCLDHIDALRS